MMFIKECLLPAQAPLPRTFSGLMELYEVNYMRIRRLCPGLDTIPHYAVSRVEGTLDLHIQILDRCKYTTTILMTYYFQEGLGHWRPNPNLEVRVYHDARQAEALSRSYRSPRSRRHAQAWKGQSELVNRWNLNRFLYKWLGFCHHQGHLFAARALHMPHSCQLKWANSLLADST
jgi:uncharacterized protein YqiB (DUF1249 family)